MLRRHRDLPARRPALLGSVGLLAAAVGGGGLHAGEAAAPNRVIVFGDSISDGGAYAALAPPGAGRFTTNPDPVWVELVAQGLGLELAPAARGGTNFAEGGARVAVSRPGGPGGLTRTPVAAQIDSFLSAGGALDARSLVIIQGGGNDVFATQLNGPDFTDADLQVLDAAAGALAAQLQRLQAAGAGMIVTTSVPRFEVFNDRYEAAIAATGANVLYVDVARLIAEIEAEPSLYGLVNVADPACRGAAVQSFVCLPQDYVTPDANRTYLFADGVHFTGAVHEMEAQLTLAAIRAPGQIGQLPLLAQAAAAARRQSLAAHLSGSRGRSAETWTLFGDVELSELSADGAPERPGLDADAAGVSFGVERALGAAASAGLAAHFTEADGDFGDDQGAVTARSLGLTLFARRAVGPAEGRVTAEYQRTDYDDITRLIPLGPSVRAETGETSGDLYALAVEADLDLVRGPFRIRPGAGLRYERVRVDGYAEAGERSSQMTFGDQTWETLSATFGVRLSGADLRAPFRPYAQLAYAFDLAGEAECFTVTPAGAPVGFTAAAWRPDGDYAVYGAGVEADLGEAATALVGVHGTTGRDGVSSVSGFAGLRVRF